MSITIVELVLSAVAIVVAAALFTNAVEILGDRLDLDQGSIGSVLAAVGTALPETMIPVVALVAALFTGASAAGEIGVGAISAGTSDVPVLGEAVAVAREMGAAVRSFHDVGVAGIHRLTQPLEELRSFDPDCLIVAAGMEGALPSVVAGLVAVPVVGLPTSTGYGLGGDGTAAILGMLQTCSPGLSVVNVDNGIGAGVTAALVANRAALGRAGETRGDGKEPGPG